MCLRHNRALLTVPRRIGNATIDPTYLMADAKVVATYRLYNIERAKLEAVIHRILEPARLVITLMDRFGNPVSPREWFLVPLFVIDEVIDRIRDGPITAYTYDPARGALVRVESSS